MPARSQIFRVTTFTVARARNITQSGAALLPIVATLAQMPITYFMLLRR